MHNHHYFHKILCINNKDENIVTIIIILKFNRSHLIIIKIRKIMNSFLLFLLKIIKNIIYSSFSYLNINSIIKTLFYYIPTFL